MELYLDLYKHVIPQSQHVKIQFLFLSANRGATLLLSSFSTCVKLLIHAAFDRHEHGKQLVSIF